MDKLQARAKSIFSWDFNFFLNDTLVAEVDVSLIKADGRFQYQGEEYEMNRERLLSGDFFLRKGDMNVAQATKESAFRREFHILYGKHSFVLKPRSLWRRDFELLENEAVVGGVYSNNLFSRTCTVDFPDKLPLPVQVFLFWLMWLLRRRSHHAAAGGH